MASLSSVTLELKVAGEQAATQALNRFYDAGEKVGTSVVGLASKVSSVQSEWKKLSDLYNRQVIGLGALSGAQEKLVSQLASLTGMTTAQARNALKLAEADQKAAQAAQQRAQADAKAAAEAQKRMQSIANLEGSILKESRAISNAVKQMGELSKAQANGTVSANKMRQAELEVARALAATNGYLKSNGQLNVQRAQAEIRAAQAAQQNADALRRQNAEEAKAATAKQQSTQQYRQLMGAINPTIALQNRMREAQRSLRQAVENGAISTQEAARALRDYRNALREADAAGNRTRTGLNQFGVITQQAGYQVGDFIVQVQSGTNVMVALGQQATQLIGTFAMLARSTRMIALFSGLGVVVPIITAIGAAMMRTAGESKTLEDRVSDLESVTDRYMETLDLLEDKDLDQTYGNMTESVRELAAVMRDLNDAAQLDNLIAVIDKMTDAANGNIFEKFFSGMAAGLTFGMVGSGKSQFEQESYEDLGMSMAREQFLAYRDELNALARSGDREGVGNLLSKMFREATDEGAQLSSEAYELFVQLDRSARRLAEMTGELNGSAQASRDAAEAEERRLDFLREETGLFSAHVVAYERAAEAEERRIEAVALYYDNLEKAEAERARIDAERKRIREGESEFLRTAEAETELARRKLEILQSYNAEGEATARTQELQIQLDMDILRGKLLQQAAADGITQAERDAINEQIRLAEETARTEAGLNNAKNAAKGLTSELRAAAAAMAALSNMGASVDVRIAGLEAEIAAYGQGLNAAAEGKRASEIEKARQKRDEALLTPGADVVGIDAEFQSLVQRLNKEAALTTKRDAIIKAQRESSRGAGAAAREAQKEDEYLYKLEQEAITKRALVGVSEEQRLQDERRAQITLKLAEDGRALTALEEKRIEGIVQMEAETRKLMQAEQERQQLIDTIEGHIQNAFMTMVDGSQSVEDAFRSMLRNIILAIYQQQVAKPAAESIGNWLTSAVTSFFGGPGMTTGTPLTIPSSGVQSLLPSANGNAFNRGLVNYFANGGVVDSITPFSYSGGTGIMGEAGPEAIMPLKRGKDGKLGVQAEGGGAVVIHQNFNFSANGDDSVKRIIRGEMPRITEATKAAVVDAKRRGGSYGRSF